MTAACFVQIVQVEEYFPHVAAVSRESLGHLFCANLGCRFCLKPCDKSLDHGKVRRGVKEFGQAGRLVRGDQQSQAAAPAESLQPESVKTAELLVAVDDDHKWITRLGNCTELCRQATLAVVQFDKVSFAPRLFDSRYERRQQCRLSRPVRGDDLSPPAVAPQAFYQLVGSLAGGEEIRQGPRPDVPGGKRVLDLLGYIIFTHDAGTSTVGTPPKRKDF